MNSLDLKRLYLTYRSDILPTLGFIAFMAFICWVFMGPLGRAVVEAM